MLIRSVPVARSGWLDGYDDGDQYRDDEQTERLADLLGGKPITLGHGGPKIGRVGRTRLVSHDDGESWVHADLHLDDAAMPAVRAGKHFCSVGHVSHRRIYLDAAGRDPGVGAQIIHDVKHLALTDGARCGDACRIPAAALGQRVDRMDRGAADYWLAWRFDDAPPLAKDDPAWIAANTDDDGTRWDVPVDVFGQAFRAALPYEARGDIDGGQAAASRVVDAYWASVAHDRLLAGPIRKDSMNKQRAADAPLPLHIAEQRAAERNRKAYRTPASNPRWSKVDAKNVTPYGHQRNPEGDSATVDRDLARANAAGANSAKPYDKADPAGTAYRDPDDDEGEDKLAAAEAAARQRSAEASRAPDPRYSREALLAKDNERRQGHRADADEPQPITSSLAEAEARGRRASATAYLAPWTGGRK